MPLFLIATSAGLISFSALESDSPLPMLAVYAIVGLGMLIMLPFTLLINYLAKITLAHRKATGEGVLSSAGWAFEFAFKKGYRSFAIAGMFLNFMAIVLSIIPMLGNLVQVAAPYILLMAVGGATIKLERKS
ncbi:MAG: hypothetical protein QW035_01710 [Candidatus Anstonellales archaeon]